LITQKAVSKILCAAFVVFIGSPILSAANAQEAAKSIRSLPLDSLDSLDIRFISEKTEAVKAKADIVTYSGRRALHMITDDSTLAAGGPSGGETLAIVNGVDFADGTIEVDLVGMPRQGSNSQSRGFIGIAFRIQGDSNTAKSENAEFENDKSEDAKFENVKFENVYLRFTNGRSDDQLRRNHSTQYSSFPDYPWSRLRQENPGVYESYVDIEEKAWTKLKVVVSGTKARLYVNNVAQPCLIVNDLKLGESHGRVALWAGSDTEAYFSNLRIK